jgi:hypothetical protein
MSFNKKSKIVLLRSTTAYRRSRGTAPLILNIGYRSERSASHPDHFSSRKTAGTHWKEGWVGPTAAMDVFI